MTQDEALQILMAGQNAFLTGPAGTGKTYVLKQYIRYLKDHEIPVAITASTGIAAAHMDGRTIHSWSGIGVRKSLTKKELRGLSLNEPTHDRIAGARVLIIDEISMLEAKVFTLLDAVCRSVRKSKKPFGGLQLVVCGDFFQLPPIQSKNEEPAEYAFKSPSWESADLCVCYLEEQFRQEDKSFLAALNSIRHSEADEDTLETLNTRLNQPIEGMAKVTRLFSHRDEVDALNSRELEKLEGGSGSYIMRSGGDAALVETLKEACLAPQTLSLKKGTLVMFVRNNPAGSYVNGTLGTVIGFEEDDTKYPIIEKKDGTKITAKPIRWSVEDGDHVLAYIEQIPLRLAWAITIHKSQGMTLDAAEINLSRAFALGMGYVALSRVKSLDAIKLIGLNDVALRVSPEVAEFDDKLRQQSEETWEQFFDKKS